MGLKKKLAMLMAAGAMCFGAKAQSYSDYHEPRDTRAPMTQQHKEKQNSGKKYGYPAAVVVGLWLAGVFDKKKKQK